MAKRIFLVHPYGPTWRPSTAFKTLAEAQTVNLLDECFTPMSPPTDPGAVLYRRVATLLQHCEASGADGIVFTGTTFGPAIEAARAHIKVPVLKAEEAMADQAVELGERILLVCTAKRAMPIVRQSLEAAAARRGVARRIGELWVAGAKDAITNGTMDAHDRLIAKAVEAAAADTDVIVLGQISMVPAQAHLSPAVARRVITSPEPRSSACAHCSHDPEKLQTFRTR